jgi:ABC-2 type transport system permease protein
MKGLSASLWAESLKLRKSNVLLIVILGFLIMPIMMGMMMYIAKDPELSEKMGMVGDKAALFGNSDWASYFRLLNAAIAMIGFVGFGFLTSWVFGREYSDRTEKDLLALPVPRSSIVLSKFIIIFMWCGLVSVILFVSGLVTGALVQLPGWSIKIVLTQANRFCLTAFLTILVSTPVAFFACIGRGYMPPLGFVIVALIAAQFAGIIGLGPYFPWAIPGLCSGFMGDEIQIGFISYFILILTCSTGLFITFAWWCFADHT